MKLITLIVALISFSFTTISAGAEGEETVFSGSFSYGADATLWWLDDSFSANFIDLETTREVPLFQDLRFSLTKVFGFDLNLHFFFDKILDPLGIFFQDLGVGLSGSSGGIQTLISTPLPVLDGEDFTGTRVEFEYRYRLFRWDNRVSKVWLDTIIDYYNEKGQRISVPLGSGFSTGSRWTNGTLGISTKMTGDFPLGFFVGGEWWDLQAPTLVSLSVRDALSTSADMVMMTHNSLLGLRFKMFMGLDPNDPQNIPDELSIGTNFGGTFGWFSATNDYLRSPSEIAFNSFGGINLGMSFQPWEGAKGFFLLGIDGTFSLLMIHGSASEAGEIKKSLTFRDMGSDSTYPAGTIVDVDISRWEVWAIPFIKVGLRF